VCSLQDEGVGFAVVTHKQTSFFVYFNLNGGRVTTKNEDGLNPGDLAVGREVRHLAGGCVL
jgi:hypothetical protein